MIFGVKISDSPEAKFPSDLTFKDLGLGLWTVELGLRLLN